MSYALVIAPDVQAVLAQLPWNVAQHVAAQLQILAEHPASLSRPVTLLALLVGQAFYFEYESSGTSYAFYVVFQYGADEQTLYVLQITVDAE